MCSAIGPIARRGGGYGSALRVHPLGTDWYVHSATRPPRTRQKYVRPSPRALSVGITSESKTRNRYSRPRSRLVAICAAVRGR